MPAENCIRRDNRRELTQCLAADRLAFDGQDATLIVGQQNSLLSKLLQQGLDLSVLELDDLGLSFVHPTTEHDKEEQPRAENEIHGIPDAES